jgi:hypothetical protein
MTDFAPQAWILDSSSLQPPLQLADIGELGEEAEALHLFKASPRAWILVVFNQASPVRGKSK